MRLYRLCNIKSVQAIQDGSFERLTFGAPLLRYINLQEGGQAYLNSYPNFQKMWEEAKNGDGKKSEERMRAIVKQFPDIPKYLPLFEKNRSMRVGHVRTYAGGRGYTRPSYTALPPYAYDMLHTERGETGRDEIFLFTLKVAAFFKEKENVVSYAQSLTSGFFPDTSFVLEIDVDDNTASRFEGVGRYKVDGGVEERKEYAFPMYMLTKELIVEATQANEFIKKNK